jgi:hypothetical protein
VDHLDQEAWEAAVIRCNTQLSEVTRERWLRWEPQLTEASLGGACIPEYTPVPGMRPYLTPELGAEQGVSQDSAANVPIRKNEVSTQTPDEPPNEAVHTLVNMYMEPGDKVMDTQADYVLPHQGTRFFYADLGIGEEDLGVGEAVGDVALAE